MKADELLKGLRRFLLAEVDEEIPTVELAEGVEAVVECGRPGKFTDMHNQTATFTPENLTELAATLDPEEALLKIGHRGIETHTAHYGNVKALRYDATKDRLLATIVPTPALVRKNREEGFRRVSMELTGKTLEGPWKFLNLAFLAARKAGVTGLAPVALAATEGERVFVFAEPDAGLAESTIRIEYEKPLDKPAKVDPDDKEQEKAKMADEKITADLAVAKADVEKHKAESERLRTQLKSGARSHVKAFLAEHAKRIPMTLRKAGLEEGLVALLAAEVEGSPITLKFSVSGGEGQEPKPVEQIASAFILTMLAALPEQITKAETTETAQGGVEDEPALEMAEDVTKESAQLDFAARREMKDAKAAGETIEYYEAVQRVERKKSRGSK